MKVIKPLEYLPKVLPFPSLFLGGSIEMGTADNWQVRMEKAFADKPGTLLNPRRDDWDSTWLQDPTTGTEFFKQVSWELDAQDRASHIIYYFDAKTKSPITLLELGIYASGYKTIFVYCPKEFYRYGNVKIVCEKFNIPCYQDEQRFITDIGLNL